MMHKGRFVAAVIALVASLVVLVGATSARAAEIKVLANPGVRSALRELGPMFESSTGHKVNLDFAVIALIKSRLDKGETFDVVIPSPEVIADLVKHGMVAPNTRTAFGRTGLAIVVPKGAAKPDISSVENLKRAFSTQNRWPIRAWERAALMSWKFSSVLGLKRR